MVTVFLCWVITGESIGQTGVDYDGENRLLALTGTQATHGTFNTIERARFEREAVHGRAIGGRDSVCRDLPIRPARITSGAIGRS